MATPETMGLVVVTVGVVVVVVLVVGTGYWALSSEPVSSTLSPNPGGSSSITTSDQSNTASTTGPITSSISTTESAGSVTGSSVYSASDTFFTSACSVTGIGGFEMRVVSDSTGTSVSGESINAVDSLGCNEEYQTVYIDTFYQGQGGWLTPAFPSQAQPGGKLTFTIVYQGTAYNLSSDVPPIGTSCVTLHVPSGNVTTTTVMNGQGSYCWQ